jgi:hypothetical protein
MYKVMNLDFLKDTGSQLLALAVIGIFGSVGQTALQGKDIAGIADDVVEIKQELSNNYNKEDAVKDKAEFERELEIIHEKVAEAEGRTNSRIEILDQRISRVGDFTKK